MEFGIRSDLLPKVSTQLAVFQQDFDSELAYDADAGQDAASAPSRRQGVELSGQYRPEPWIEFNTDLALSRARYRGDLAAFDLDGPWIANAPKFIGSFGCAGEQSWPLDRRAAVAQARTLSDQRWRSVPEDSGYSEFNLDMGYKLNANLKLQLSIYNVFNSHADSSAYFYTSRVRNEPLEGVDGIQVHPLEPISGVLKITAYF